VLPCETSLGSRRISQQDKLIADDHKNLMLDNLDDLNFHRLKALENIRANKIKLLSPIIRRYEREDSVKLNWFRR